MCRAATRPTRAGATPHAFSVIRHFRRLSEGGTGGRHDMGKLLPIEVVSREEYAADEAAAAAHGVALRDLRRPAILEYDVASHRLREVVLACLGMPSAGTAHTDGEALEALRAPKENPDPYHQRLQRSGYRGPSTFYIKKWYCGTRNPAPTGKLFDKAYCDFVRHVILPHVGDPQGIVFQRRPTFRCHVAKGGEATGKVHNDSQYGHSRCELNFWLPLTRTVGSNSLFAESAPGAKDFAPFELEYGQCQRFWGAQCVHYTEPNETDLTRVSIDFRVLPRSCHEDGTGYRRQFSLGCFFAAMDAEGSVTHWGDKGEAETDGDGGEGEDEADDPVAADARRAADEVGSEQQMEGDAVAPILIKGSQS